MSEKRVGTLLCGWCLGPPGARRPHMFGVPVGNCPCGCHRKPRRMEAPRKVETQDCVVRFMRGGPVDAAA